MSEDQNLEPMPATGGVTLRGGDLPWRSVSPNLAKARIIVTLVTLGVVALVAALAAVMVTRWLWIVVAASVLLAGWLLWLIPRQVSAISFLELPDEIVIRRGRVLRVLVSVPYGRLQYVDLQSGPLSRSLGIASLEIHTASPQSGGSIPGLPAEEAEQLRARLMALGEATRAGL